MAKTPEEKETAKREARRKWRELHPEQDNASSRKWAKAHPEVRNEISKRYFKLHPEICLAAYRKRKYGITPEEYEQLLTDQNEVCAICGGNRDKRELCVDHSHTTGTIRGLLCQKCNMGLGYFADNLAWLRKAVNYLEATK